VAAARFFVSSILGLAFFLLPLPVGDRFTVPFDLAVQWLIGTAPSIVGMYCLALIVVGGTRTRRVTFLAVVRALAIPLALLYFLRRFPDPAVSGVMWETLAFSVGVIIPVGAALLAFFVDYGFLDFVGALMRPVMQPLFCLPGRAALDSLTSWVGSYSVGLYLTRKLLEEGYYTRREAYTIVTCFSTVSIGFVAVVAQTLAILHLFPVIFVTYFLAVYLLTILFARIWPVTATPDSYVVEGRPEADSVGFREAFRRALSRAEGAESMGVTLRRGFLDGLSLASTILGSILVVGTAALLIARETPLFVWLGAPLVPVLTALGLSDAELLAPATLVGIAEMYVPALLTQEASIPSRFFIAVLSISQLIFFSAVGPMMLDMFRSVPIRARELVAIFFLRTAVLVPLLAGVTNVLERAGLF
jgi:nucleoside recognition membrane protein YjiH